MPTVDENQQKNPNYYQFFKFVVVGALNTIVDFGVLNLLIIATTKTSGGYYTFFKAISFSAAVINSYFFNRYWTFKDSKEKNPAAQFGKFILISIVGFGINIGIASIVVNVIGAQFGLSAHLWANVGAIIATLIAWVWNFSGYKFWAFKKQSN